MNTTTTKPSCPECSEPIQVWIEMQGSGEAVYKAACVNPHCVAPPEAVSTISAEDAIRKIGQ